MGYFVGAVLAVAVVIYVLMKFWWLALAVALAVVTSRQLRTTAAARQAQRELIATEHAGLRHRADEGHAAYLRGDPTF